MRGPTTATRAVNGSRKNASVVVPASRSLVQRSDNGRERREGCGRQRGEQRQGRRRPCRARRGRSAPGRRLPARSREGAAARARRCPRPGGRSARPGRRRAAAGRVPPRARAGWSRRPADEGGGPEREQDETCGAGGELERPDREVRAAVTRERPDQPRLGAGQECESGEEHGTESAPAARARRRVPRARPQVERCQHDPSKGAVRGAA